MSLSSSSSSSSLDSSASSILGASQWNREKANRPVQGKPGWGIGLVSSFEDMSTTSNNDDKNEEEKSDKTQQHLLQRRLYPTLSFPTQASSMSSSHVTEETKEKEETPPPEKSELEVAVLQDVLSNNFLFSHLPKAEHQRLLSRFEKVKFRKNEVIIRQGDIVDSFYMLYLGDVKILQDGLDVRQPATTDTDKYTVFGELELLTNAARSATVKATSTTCTLFRLSKQDYQLALSQQQQSTASSLEERIQLLKDALPREMVEYLEGDEIAFNKLVSAMTTHVFQKGKVLYRKETRLAALVIIAKGQVLAKDISMGGRAYEDMAIGPGESKKSFGWQSIMSDNESDATTPSTAKDEERMTGTIVAATDGAAVVITKKAFTNALGHHHHHGGIASLQLLAAKRLARIQLQQITVFKDSALDDTQINGLLDLMHHYEFSHKEVIFKAGDKVDAAMYFVREGSVVLETNRGQTQQTIEAGGYFGEKNMLLDQNKEGHKHFEFRSPMTVFAAANNTTTKVDILYLEECRQVVNTTLLGLGQRATVSAIDDTVQWSDITRHAMLGTGSFGQVWLASIPAAGLPLSSSQEDTTTSELNDNSQRRIVALKVQAKHLLAQSPDRAERIVAEKNVMASLRSPFIIRLLNSFQDDTRLYMITSILQGGELESIIPHDGLSEGAAKFYAAGILEGLSHLHRRHIIHRDVKPENVLIDDKGYPVLIDLGFAKYVPDKTFTFCGSPMLTAPEIIRYKGYDRGCDNWAWAVVVYRLVTGKYPFYQKGMDELALYKRICRGTFELDGTMSIEFRMLMVAMLYPDPSQRLGSRVNGWRDIFAAPWFANDDTIDLRKLRKQQISAPWVPALQDPCDASRFHHDSSSAEDLMMDTLPGISEAQQKIFDSFGPRIAG